MVNFRCKWVLRYDPNNKQFRIIRVVWQTKDLKCSYKLSVSIKGFLPRVSLRKSLGGVFV